MRFTTICALLVVGFCHGLGQETARKLPSTKLDSAPVIDGKLDDEAWKQASHVTDFVDRFSGSAPTEKSEAWIGYDDKAIYVAFKCYDSEPDKIIAKEIKPGVELTGDDAVILRIDPFYTRGYSGMSFFRVNAIGTQNDEIAGGRAAKREWRGDWQAAAQRTADGYTVEMRIPWEVMDHPNGGIRDLNFNFLRWHGRQNTVSIWSYTTANERPELNGVWQAVNMPTSRAKPKVQLLPYTVGEWDFEHNKFGFDTGLDVKYPITSQFTGVASINPDFKNIEQAVEGIEFSRSERFLDESRPFFSEGSDLFNLTAEYGVGRLFYSRRIADFNAGVKGYGQLNNKLSLGALATYGKDDVVNAAFNVHYDADPKTNLSMFATSHNGQNRQDSVYGGTFNRTRGNWSFAGEGMLESDANFNSKAYTISTDYSVPKLFGQLRYSAIDPTFNPVLGYIPFNDRRGASIYLEHNNEFKDSWIRRSHAEAFISSFDHYDGSEAEKGWNVFQVFRLRNDQNFFVGYENRVWDGARDTVFSGGWTYGTTNRFRRFGGTFNVGKRADHDYKLYSLNSSLRVLRRIDLGAEYARQEFFGTDDQLVGTVSWEMDAKRSLSGRIVQTNGTTNWYLAFRSAGFKGAELFVILGDPNTPEFRQRFAIKLVVPVG